MIKLLNITKKIKNQTILSNINLTLPETGLIVICGPSGCGKSTLLNIMAGLDDQYDGICLINGKNIRNEEIRVPYVNQQNMTLADENLMSNVEISSSFANKKISNANFNKLLKELDLRQTLCKQKAKTFSGGENQRLALIMGIAKDSNILICDEITSKLDQKNAELVVKKLQLLAKSKLIVLVTHDYELIKNSYQILIRMEDGKILSYEQRKETIGSDKHANFAYKKLNIKKIIPIVFHKIVAKKRRVSLCIGLLSTGLVAFSLSLFISNVLKKNLSEAFSSLFGKNEVVMRYKLKNEEKKLTDVNYEEYKYILSHYTEYFSSIGVDYKTNIDGILPQNDCQILRGNKSLYMPNLKIGEINCFEYIEGTLDNDEIILSLSQIDLKNICLFLNLSNTNVNLLNNFLMSNTILMSFKVGNISWNYSDTITFKISKIENDEETKIKHSNPLFNQYIYEDLMRFKNIDEIVEEVPWALDKQYFLRAYDVKNFLRYSFSDDFFKKYLPAQYKDFIKFYDCQALSINNNDIALNILNKVETNNIKLSTNGSYLILENAAMSGFSSDFLLTNDALLLDNTVEFNSSVEKGKSLKYPSEIYVGNITNLAAKNINFSSDLSNIRGNLPTQTEEIVISTRLATEMFGKDWENQDVYVAFLKNKIDSNNVIKNYFSRAKLKVVGVVESEQYLIYQNFYWLISFFRDYLEIENQNLLVDAVQFTITEHINSADFVAKLNSNEIFTYKNVTENISSTIQDSIDILRCILLVFSAFTTCLAILMLILILYLFNKENKNDFAAIYAMGGKHRDVMNYKYIYLVFIIIAAFIFSTAILVIFFSCFKYQKLMFFEYAAQDLLNIFWHLCIIVFLLILILRIFFIIIIQNDKNYICHINYHE